MSPPQPASFGEKFLIAFFLISSCYLVVGVALRVKQHQAAGRDWRTRPKLELLPQSLLLLPGKGPSYAEVVGLVQDGVAFAVSRGRARGAGAGGSGSPPRSRYKEVKAAPGSASAAGAPATAADFVVGADVEYLSSKGEWKLTTVTAVHPSSGAVDTKIKAKISDVSKLRLVRVVKDKKAEKSAEKVILKCFLVFIPRVIPAANPQAYSLPIAW